MNGGIKPVLIALAILLIGGAIIFLTYFLYISKIPKPDTMEVLHWKNKYQLSIKEIQDNSIILTGYIARDNRVTITAELEPYIKIYKLIQKYDKNVIITGDDNALPPTGMPLPPKRREIGLKDLKVGQSINIFTPDDALNGNTIRVVKIEYLERN